MPMTKLRNEIEEIPSVDMKKVRMKYLRFHENHRPSFYGSVPKAPDTIHTRNPLHKYNIVADYENDSDDEWEEDGT